MDQNEDIIAGARVNRLGVQGNLIFGEVTKYGDSDTQMNPWIFLGRLQAGEIRAGLDLESWRAKLKEKGGRKAGTVTV